MKHPALAAAASAASGLFLSEVGVKQSAADEEHV